MLTREYQLYARPYQNLIYHPWYGQLIWAKRPYRSNIAAGSIAGCVDTNGYRRITIGGVLYSSHRIIWEMFNGSIPKGMEIDHIDGDRDNNRIENLRLATISQNRQNSVVHSDNKLAIKGVCWHKATQKWRGYVQLNKKNHTKSFNDMQDAVNWVIEMRTKLHGKFVNHGIHEKDIC